MRDVTILVHHQAGALDRRVLRFVDQRVLVVKEQHILYPAFADLPQKLAIPAPSNARKFAAAADSR